MKIEITDRYMWMDKCRTVLELIKDQRNKLDEEYVNNWRNSIPKFLQKIPFFNRADKLPGTNGYIYPSYLWFSSKINASHLLILLQSNGTGSIFIDEEELINIEEIIKCGL